MPTRACAHVAEGLSPACARSGVDVQRDSHRLTVGEWRGARGTRPRASKSLRWSETSRRPPPLQQGPRRCSVRYLLAGQRLASDYSSNLTRKVNVLDFIKSGGLFLPLLLFSGVGSHVLRAEHGSPEYQGLLFRLRGM